MSRLKKRAIRAECGSNPEGKRADTGGEESLVWSQPSLFAYPANDAQS